MIDFSKSFGEVNGLGKEIFQKEICLEVLRGLSLAWNIKATAMRDHRNLNTPSIDKLFNDLKAYEFAMLSKLEDDDKENGSTLIAEQPSTSHRSNEKLNNLLSDEQFTMFVRKFQKFMRKSNMHAGKRIIHDIFKKINKRVETSESKGPLLKL